MPLRQLVTIFSASGTPRFLPPGKILDAAWSLSARGGHESITLPLAAKFDQLTHLLPGDQVNVYTQAAPGDVAQLRCRAHHGTDRASVCIASAYLIERIVYRYPSRLRGFACVTSARFLLRDSLIRLMTHNPCDTPSHAAKCGNPARCRS